MANDRNKKNRSIQASTNVFLTSFSGGRQRQLTTWLNSVFVFENSGIWRDRSKSMTHYTDCEKMSPKSRIFSKSAKSSHSNFWADFSIFSISSNSNIFFASKTGQIAIRDYWVNFWRENSYEMDVHPQKDIRSVRCCNQEGPKRGSRFAQPIIFVRDFLEDFHTLWEQFMIS